MLCRAHHIAEGAHSRQSSTDSVQQEKALRSLVLSDAEDGELRLCFCAQGPIMQKIVTPAWKGWHVTAEGGLSAYHGLLLCGCSCLSTLL